MSKHRQCKVEEEFIVKWSSAILKSCWIQSSGMRRGNDRHTECDVVSLERGGNTPQKSRVTH